MFEERMSQSREAQRRNIELMRNASRTLSVDDPIVISDDSNDSSVEVITFLMFSCVIEIIIFYFTILLLYYNLF